MRTYDTTRPDDDEPVEALMQIVDVDGTDEVILRETPVLNGSGRAIGTEFTVSDETATVIDTAVEKGRALDEEQRS